MAAKKGLIDKKKIATGTQSLFSFETGIRMKYIIEIWDEYIISDYFILCFHILKITFVFSIDEYRFFVQFAYK